MAIKQASQIALQALLIKTDYFKICNQLQLITITDYDYPSPVLISGLSKTVAIKQASQIAQQAKENIPNITVDIIYVLERGLQ